MEVLMRKIPDKVKWHLLEPDGGAGGGIEKTAHPTKMAEELFTKVKAMG